MAIAVVDVLAPAGRIEPDLFPGEGSGASGTALHTRLTAYVTEAVDKSGLVAAQAAWVEFRAFDAACIRLSALPSRITQTDAGGHDYATDQRRTICQLAADARAEFERLTAPPPAADPVPVGPRSRTVTNTFDW